MRNENESREEKGTFISYLIVAIVVLTYRWIFFNDLNLELKVLVLHILPKQDYIIIFPKLWYTL